MRMLLSLALLLPGIVYGQQRLNTNAETIGNVKGLPPGKNSILVRYAKLMKIARKYGVEKNFTLKPDSTNKSGKLPKKVYLKMSLAQFDAWMKQLGFQEKKVQILNQFFLHDFQKISTVKEYVDLRRAYVKKYPEYLKDVESFKEERIKHDEDHPELLNLNTPYFRKEGKQN